MPVLFANPLCGIGFIVDYAIYKEMNKEKIICRYR
jgi:hypothetical protein